MKSTFDALVPLIGIMILLQACGRADIREDCHINGMGQITCAFTNKGNAKGSVCLRPVLKGSERFFVGDNEICSGIVAAGDVRETNRLMSFAHQRPMDICRETTSEREDCEFLLVSEEKVEEMKRQTEAERRKKIEEKQKNEVETAQKRAQFGPLCKRFLEKMKVNEFDQEGQRFKLEMLELGFNESDCQRLLEGG